MKIDILAIGVHPDDVELSCSGTLLKHIAAGKKVGLLDLSRGELGTRGHAALRIEEANESARLMGALFRENIAIPDGFFQHTEENLRKIIRVIRRYQPEIVLANAIRDRHPDHGRAAKLCYDACFLAGLVKVETEWEGNQQEQWRPKALYHYIQDKYIEPDFVVDMTSYMEKKIELILAFKSQFYDPNSEEPETPISSKDFMEIQYAKCRLHGRPIGVSYAEGFTAARTPGVDSMFDLL